MPVSYIAYCNSLSQYPNSIKTMADDVLSVGSDDEVIGDMDTPMDINIPPADLPDNDNYNGGNNDNNNNDNNDDGMAADLIPEADFAADIAAPENTNGGGDDNYNNNNDTAINETDDIAVPTSGQGNTDDNNDNDAAYLDQPKPAYGQSDDALMNDIVNNINVAIDNGSPQSGGNAQDNIQLEIGSAFDATANDEIGRDNEMNVVNADYTGDNQFEVQRNERGASVFNVEAVPMNESGTDTHGPIPNLIVELRFDLKLAFQGIDIDDSIVGPMIGLRPIIEQRIGQDFQELVRGVVNDDPKVCILLTQYNDADAKFYKAAKYGSVGK